MKRVDSSPDSISALFEDTDPPPLIHTLPPAVTASSDQLDRVGLFELRRRLTPRVAESHRQPLLISTVSLIVGVLAAFGAPELLPSQMPRVVFASLAALFLARVCVRKARRTPPAPLRQKRASGARHVLQISDDGVVFAMGDSALDEEGEAWLGHLGHGVEWGERVATPTAVSLPTECEVVAVAAGNLHSLFLCGSGTVYACGFGIDGPLGLGHEASIAVPRAVAALDGVCVRSIAAGGAHSLAVCSQGAVWSWGWGRWGQLGHGDEAKALAPRRITALTKPVVQVAAGGAHSLVLGADGAVYSFGSASHGQCGHGTRATHVLCPTRVEALRRVAVCEVHAQADASAALLSSTPGALYVWGELGGSEAVRVPTLSADCAGMM